MLCLIPLILNYSVRSLYSHTNSYNNAVTQCYVDGSEGSLDHLWEILGAFHYAKDPWNFGWNSNCSNGKVRFGFFWPEHSGSPLEVVHTFRSECSNRISPFHFWQTGSLPQLGNSGKEFKLQGPFLLVSPVKSENVVPFSLGISTDLWPVSLT